MSALVVNFNAEASAATLNLDATSVQVANAIQELSSGLAVQFPDQGPASWSISNFLQNQNAGLQSAVSNTQQGSAVLNIASGAVNQIAGILQQMNTLATQNANGGALTTSAQAANNTEYNSLVTELNDIVNNTTYGTKQLLNGSYVNECFQIGFQNTNNFFLTVSTLSVGASGINIAAANGINTVSAASATMASIQTAINYLGNVGAQIGSAQLEMQAFTQDLQTTSSNVESANSTLVDANMASAMTSFTTDQILLQSGLSMLGQAQANPTLVLKLL